MHAAVFTEMCENNVFPHLEFSRCSPSERYLNNTADRGKGSAQQSYYHRNSSEDMGRAGDKAQAPASLQSWEGCIKTLYPAMD